MCSELSELQTIVDEFCLLLAESRHFWQTSDVSVYKQKICEYYEESLHILQGIQKQLDKNDYVIAVVGLNNVGKSTLVNAILGNSFTPTKNGLCTTVPIEFRYGAFAVQPLYHNLRMPHIHSCENIENIVVYLNELNQLSTQKKLKKIVVYIPNPLLQHGLIISDTPGFSSVDSNPQNAMIQKYLQEDVSQIIWVVLAEQGITKPEEQFYRQYLADICHYLVITGCEEWDADDQQRFYTRFDKIGLSFLQFYFVSGLQGLQAKQQHNSELLKKSGIPNLEQQLDEVSKTTQKLENGKKILCELSLNLNQQLVQLYTTHNICLSVWRQDSWKRFQACLAKLIYTQQLGKILHSRLKIN